MAFLRIRPGRSSWMEKSEMGKLCWYRQNSLFQNLDLNIRLVSVVSYHLPFICWCFEGALNWKIGQKWFCNALHDLVPLYNVKNVKNINRGVLLLVKFQTEACSFIRSNTPPWMSSTYFKLYKWCQIPLSSTYGKPNSNVSVFGINSYRGQIFAYLFYRLCCKDVSEDLQTPWMICHISTANFLRKPTVKLEVLILLARSLKIFPNPSWLSIR